MYFGCNKLLPRLKGDKKIFTRVLRKPHHQLPCLIGICWGLFILLGFSFTTFPNPAFAAETQWVTVEGLASIENITKQEARRRAIEDAMRSAVAMVAGVNILAESLLINYRLTGDIVKAIPHGKVLEKEMIEEDVDKVFQKGVTAPSLIYKVRMRIKVAKDSGSRDPYFNLEASCNRAAFKEGDEMQIKIRPTKECYLYLFNILEDDKVIRLLPNSYQSNNFVKANELLIFPSLEDKNKGITLIAHLPKGKEGTTETIYLLALKKPLTTDLEKFAEGIYSVYDGCTAFIMDLVKDCVMVPPADRAERYIQYSITK